MGKDAVISLECHKLMFMLAVVAVNNLEAGIDDDRMAELGAVFELSKERMVSAMQEFSQLFAAFTEDRKRVINEWMRKRH